MLFICFFNQDYLSSNYIQASAGLKFSFHWIGVCSENSVNNISFRSFFKGMFYFIIFFFFNLFIYFYSVTIVCIFSPFLHPTPASPT